MKTLSLILLFFVSSVHAQDGQSIVREKSLATRGAYTAAQGVRVALVKSFFDAEVDFGDFSSSGDADQEYGFALGYAYIPVDDLGFILNSVYNFYDDEIENFRFEASVSYAASDILYIFGGFNTSTYTALFSNQTDLLGNRLDWSSEFGLGYQLGIGIQATDRLGISLAYYETNSAVQIESSALNLDTDLQMDGLELQLNATF